MGTSTSSGGSPGGVPLIPPWVPPVPPPSGPPEAGPPNGEPAPLPQTPPAAPATTPASPAIPDFAPSRRFGGARLRLGRFAKNGFPSDLAAGIRAYTKTGLGGAQRAAARMAGTSRTAGRLHGVLDALRTSEALPPDVAIDPAALAGRDAREIGDAIAEAIQPSDGTLDAEASRDAIAQAISDLVEQTPSVDLMALTPQEIEFVVERYVAYDLSHRIMLDVGLAVQDKAPDAAAAVSRIEDMKAYVKQCVAASFRSARDRGLRLTRTSAASIANAVLEETFRVFAEWLP